jgi:citrate lyase beta subunit
MLVSIFTPAWFYLTAPVYENFWNEEILKKEFSIDLQYGLVWKTVIHPSQIKHIHESLKVKKADLESAKHILDKDAKAVFKFNWSMCEPSTHHKWALEIIERDKYFWSR